MNLSLLALIAVLFSLVGAWVFVTIRGGSVNRHWWPLVIGVFIGWNALVPVIRAVTYGGVIVDEETGASLSGAVVTVIWYDRRIIHMARTKDFLNASEVVTKNDGSFVLWTWPGISLNPFTYVLTPPEVIIYKAGYAPLSAPTTYDRGFRSYEALEDALKKSAVVKLPKLTTKEERLRFADPASLSIPNVPSYKVYNLIKEINVHRKETGLVSQIS